jgi:hypothetical protein
MADGLLVDVGGGPDKIGTDEDTGAGWHVGLSKLVCGPNGTFTYIGDGAGTEATALRVTLPTDCTGLLAVQGEQTHDAVESTNPLLQGAHALTHGANPGAVSNGDLTKVYANRHGVPWVIGGHPNVLSKEWTFTTQQTDAALITIGPGNIIVVTECTISTETAGTDVRVGFGTATIPAAGTAGTDGIANSQLNMAADTRYPRGNGSGIISIGADNEDLRITTSGAVNVLVLVSYYTIES